MGRCSLMSASPRSIVSQQNHRHLVSEGNLITITHAYHMLNAEHQILHSISTMPMLLKISHFVRTFPALRHEMVLVEDASLGF